MESVKKTIPLYQQIKTYLEEKIEGGVYETHDRLPSEAELAKQFKVSRITAKNAINKLVEDEKAYRIPGKGTFVDEPSKIVQVNQKKVENDYAYPPFIGLIMPEVIEEHSAKILSSIENAATDIGYGLILRQSNHQIDVEKKAIRSLLQMGVKGLIVFPVDDQLYNEELLRLKLDHFPLVLIDRYLKGIKASAVYSDNVQGAYQLTKMLRPDHKQVSLFTVPHFETTTILDRMKGFEQALDEVGISINRSNWFTDILHEEAVDKAVTLLQTNPDITGIFAMNAFAGKIAYQAVQQLDKQLPREFSIASFDQERELKRYPIFTAKQNSTQIGKEAVRLLQSQLKDKNDIHQIVLPVKIYFQTNEVKLETSEL